MASTRDTILGAALGLFAERGFHGASMPELAGRAGVASGTPYRHFESKEQLVNAVYRRCKRELMESLFGGFPYDATERDQFRVFFFRIVGFFKERPEVFDFLELHHHQPYLDRDNLELEVQSLTPALVFFEHARRAKITRAVPEKALLAVVWGIFSGLWKAERLGYLETTQELWAQAEACAWDAVRRPEPHSENTA